MKRIILLLVMVAITFYSFAQDNTGIYEQLNKEADNILLLAARISSLNRTNGETTFDTLRLKAASINVGRYIFDIQNIVSLYSAYIKIVDENDKNIIRELISSNLQFLYIRLLGEKTTLFGTPKLIDPLEFDSYQARKEVSAVIDELEKLGYRLESIRKKMIE